MADFDNTNRGSIWKNEKKEKDTHPDFTGSLNVDGKDYWVSAWKRKEGAAARSPALSFSLKLKDGKPMNADRVPGPSRAAEQRNDDMDDIIPF